MIDINEFGKAIKKRLIDLDKPQTWLYEQVTAKTGLFFDSSYLWKLTHDKAASKTITDAIKEILDLQDG